MKSSYSGGESTEQDDGLRKLRGRLLRSMGVAVFLLFFQTYMIAPIIPSLADSFHAARQAVGLLIPAYALPYAAAALICGALADRFGRREILFFALTAFPLLSLAMAVAPGLDALLFLRVLSGLTNVGIVVIGLSLIGDLFPPRERGHAIGWVFGAVAGGCSFGSTFGGILAPFIGWRGLFLLVAAAGVFSFVGAVPLWRQLKSKKEPAAVSEVTAASLWAGYLTLLRAPRAAKTYSYIVLNGLFHSGVFTWLGVLLHDRYGLGDVGIGLALLGYGIPGMFLGPVIGRLVDRYGRRLFIPLGMMTAAVSALLLAPSWPLSVAIIAITVLSLGFDMSHPLFAGIATGLSEERRGQAVGLNTFALFLGFGSGSLLFGWLTEWGMPFALVTFGAVQAALGLLSLRLFRNE